jgi:chorismate mutase
MSNLIAAGLLSAGLLFSASLPAAPAGGEEVASLINKRLGYMKDVAGYKAINHLPVEDLAQERRVLDSSVAQAKELGLASEAMEAFIQAQMDAAKAIQYRYRADWLAAPEPQWQPQPLDRVRGEIGNLSDLILQAISAALKEGTPFTEQTAFMRTLQQRNLSDSDKQRLWDALQRVTLQKQ